MPSSYRSLGPIYLRVILSVVLSLSEATQAFGQDEDSEGEAVPMVTARRSLTVAETLKSANFSLVVDQISVQALDQESVEVPDTVRSWLVGLADVQGRMVDFQYRRPDAEMLADLAPHHWYLAALAGGVVTARDPWRDNDLAGMRVRLGLSLERFWGPWSAALDLSRSMITGVPTPGSLLQYSILHMGIVGAREWAMGGSEPTVRRWHLGVGVGLHYGWHRFMQLSDQLQEDEQGNVVAVAARKHRSVDLPGAILMARARQPLTDGIWIDFRYLLVYETVQVKALNLRARAPLQALSVGFGIGL